MMIFNKKQFLAVVLLAWIPCGLTQAEDPANSLTVGEGFVNPLGFHDVTPTFSWKLPDGTRAQTAYRIEVNNESVIWDSGWVESDQSVFVPYKGEPLQSRQRLNWRVNVKDEDGKEAGWSESATFELGLMSKDDWSGKWIRPADEGSSEIEHVTRFRRKFEAADSIKTARLFVAARGVFEVSLNGQKVAEDHFANGFTSYKNRLDSLTYDVTDLLQEGENSFDAMLGFGWFAGRFGFKGERHYFGPYPELLLQLEIEYNDGSKKTIVSDENWEATFDGPIVSSSIYDGEHFDARKEWTNWKPVVVNEDLGKARIVPKPFPTVKQKQTVPAKEITEPQPGHFVFDLGQNIVGWVKLNIPTEKGKTTTVRFAEMLNSDGTMHTKNYRGAKSTDSYTAAETGNIEWEPKFTFHGFQFVELSGLPAGVKPDKDWVTGIVLYSDLAQIGTFDSSHAKLNQLQSNIVWGQRGNFLDIPTDCPQRDERMGWTGDAQAFIPTSMFNYECNAFWKSWLGSMRDDQSDNGKIPHVIPDVLGAGGSPGWMDAATFVPWEVYVRAGDVETLSDNYEMMERLVGWYRGQTVDGLIPKIRAFGDWLQPYAEDNRGDTPHPLLALAFYGRSCQILADTARVLGKEEDAKKYSDEAKSIADSFAKHYFDAEGKIQNAPETQTTYLLAIEFNLIPKSMHEKATANLIRLIDEADGHLRTGFLGTPYIVSVLDKMGRSDLALSLLFKETYPSWFYSINQGATTVWERWNSYSKEDGFHGANMNSLNHYAYGAVGQWMYERIAGLSPDPKKPGYKHFYVRPLIAEQLDWAKAELQTAYGLASSGWKKESGKLVLDVVVPPNTTATIEFPNDRETETVVAGTYHYELKQ
jgi:alpha-L-rhamnosidase